MQLGFGHLHDVRERDIFWVPDSSLCWGVDELHSKHCQLKYRAKKLPPCSFSFAVKADVVLSSSCTHLEHCSLVAFTLAQINPWIYSGLSSTIHNKHQLHIYGTETLRKNQNKEQYFHNKAPELLRAQELCSMSHSWWRSMLRHRNWDM